MRDGNVTPKVTLRDAPEGDADADAEGQYPGWLPSWSVSQDAEIISSLSVLFRPEQKKQRFSVSVLTD
jgi:hypothetical protein